MSFQYFKFTREVWDNRGTTNLTYGDRLIQTEDNQKESEAPNSFACTSTSEDKLAFSRSFPASFLFAWSSCEDRFGERRWVARRYSQLKTIKNPEQNAAFIRSFSGTDRDIAEFAQFDLRAAFVARTTIARGGITPKEGGTMHQQERCYLKH